MTNDELDLIETKDLVDVLGRRFKHVLVVTCADRNGDAMTTHFRGGFVSAVGLACYAQNNILQNSTMGPQSGTD